MPDLIIIRLLIQENDLQFRLLHSVWLTILQGNSQILPVGGGHRHFQAAFCIIGYFLAHQVQDKAVGGYCRIQFLLNLRSLAGFREGAQDVLSLAQVTA